MVRITRRDFLKYCSIAAGALGLSASTLMKVEKVLASNAASAPVVVWLSGSACTGCTMSLLNSVFYTSVDDLLLNRINLRYLDTAMAVAGAYEDTNTEYTGANAISEAQRIFSGTTPFVLVVEGAIPTGTPPGGAAGDYCRIGDLTGSGAESVHANVTAFANHAQCLAVLSVGTCSSFGGIPGAQGNVTGAMGVAFSGTKKGGAIVSDSSTGSVQAIQVTNHGSGYSGTLTVDVAGPATAHAVRGGTITSITVTNGGSGYDTAPAVNILGMYRTKATATAVLTADVVTGITVTSQGSGYSMISGEVKIDIDSVNGKGTGAIANPVIVGDSIESIIVDLAGSGYTSAPAVTFTASAGSGATAVALVSGRKAVSTRTGLAAKVVNISGCPPHPDWIVGTIAHILDTNITLPAVNANYQPVDYGYKEYQCNAGPCPWRFNNAAGSDYENIRYPVGDSKALGANKWTGLDMGCIGILGCKGRKTKADCSRRRWNSDVPETYGVNWCVGSRAGCHGCTEPSFPDKVGKFFTFA